MKKKLMKNVIMVTLCFCCIFLFKSITVNAAMADEAEDYDLGETYYGGFHNGVYSSEERYFKFTIPEKSHTTLYVTFQRYGDGEYGYNTSIYNAQGKKVLKSDDLSYRQNKTTGKYTANQFRNLPSGTYYLAIDAYRVDFSFKIQAEKQIKLSKGSISSLRSNKKGQMTVKCKTIKNAIGYRIQYSTDYKFKKGVKTVYSPTTSKTIKSLKKGKRYYVKVCPYNVYDDGTYIFGQNSYVKKVVIKKK